MKNKKFTRFLAIALTAALTISDMTIPVAAQNNNTDEVVSDVVTEQTEIEDGQVVADTEESEETVSDAGLIDETVEEELPFAPEEALDDVEAQADFIEDAIDIAVGDRIQATVKQQEEGQYFRFNCKESGFYYIPGLIEWQIDVKDSEDENILNSYAWGKKGVYNNMTIAYLDAGTEYYFFLTKWGWNEDRTESLREDIDEIFCKKDVYEITNETTASDVFSTEDGLAIFTLPTNDTYSIDIDVERDEDDRLYVITQCWDRNGELSVYWGEGSEGESIYLTAQRDDIIYTEGTVSYTIQNEELADNPDGQVYIFVYAVMDLNEDTEHVAPTKLSGIQKIDAISLDESASYDFDENDLNDDTLTFSYVVPEDGYYAICSDVDYFYYDIEFINGEEKLARKITDNLYYLKGGRTCYFTCEFCFGLRFSRMYMQKVEPITFDADHTAVTTDVAGPVLIENSLLTEEGTYGIHISNDSTFEKDINLEPNVELVYRISDDVYAPFDYPAYRHYQLDTQRENIKAGESIDFYVSAKLQKDDWSEVDFDHYKYLFVDFRTKNPLGGTTTVSVEKMEERTVDVELYEQYLSNISKYTDTYHFVAPEKGAYSIVVHGPGIIGPYRIEKNGNESYLSITNSCESLAMDGKANVYTVTLEKDEAFDFYFKNPTDDYLLTVVPPDGCVKLVYDADDYERFLAEGGKLIEIKSNTTDTMGRFMASSVYTMDEKYSGGAILSAANFFLFDVSGMKNRWTPKRIYKTTPKVDQYSGAYYYYYTLCSEPNVYTYAQLSDSISKFTEGEVKIAEIKKVLPDSDGYRNNVQPVNLTDTIGTEDVILVKRAPHEMEGDERITRELKIDGTKSIADGDRLDVNFVLGYNLYAISTEHFPNGESRVLVNPEVKVTSTDSSVATASFSGGYGTFVLGKAGEATITVETNDGGVKASTSFTVVVPEQEFFIRYNLGWGVTDAKNHPDNPYTFKNSAEPIVLKAPTRPGYKFVEWRTNAGYPIKKVKNQDMEVLAVWEKASKAYNVRFYGNGSTGGLMSDCQLPIDEFKELPSNGFERTGYEFAGWNTKADGTGTKYADGASVKNLSKTNGATVKLYAQWKANKYQVAFDANSGESKDGNPMPNQTLTYNKKQILSKNAYTKNGYSFKGWATTPTALEDNKTAEEPLPIYANEAEAKFNLTTASDEVITLYAQWAINTYKITYENVKGSTTYPVTDRGENPTSYTVNDASFDLADPVRPGYTFDGWYTKSDYRASSKIAGIDTGAAKNYTVYAKWIANKYTVVYDGNGNTNTATMKNQTFTVGKDKALSDNVFKKDGYSFAGWYAYDEQDEQIGDTLYKDEKVIKSALSLVDGATVTLKAQWTLKNYTISYEWKGNSTYPVTDKADNPTKHTIEDDAIVLNTPSRPGYTFVGFYTTSTYKASSLITEIPANSTKTYKLYTKWTANKYKVHFDGNGNTNDVSMPDLTFTVGKDKELPKNLFKKTGYKFAGWEVVSEGLNSYYEGRTVKNKSLITKPFTKEPDCDVTLRAKWTPITYTVKISANGGTAQGTVVKTLTCKYDEEKAIPDNIYEKSGYVFTRSFGTKKDGYMRWQKGEEDYGRLIYSGAPFSNLTTTDGAEVVLYAQYVVTVE